MAVYTVLNFAQLSALLMPYRLGALASVQAATEGVENTNYFLDIAGEEGAVQSYLLTIFEHLQGSELAFYLHWLEQLEKLALPVAPAIADRTGRRWTTVSRKPAALFPKLPGRHPHLPDLSHCRAIGSALGRMHAAALDLGEHHTGPRSLEWLEALCADLLPILPRDDSSLMESALRASAPLRAESTLPFGLIHGDLFPDNTLFVGDQLTGLVDFFSGGDGLLCFDLGVCANAWCSREDGSLCQSRVDGLLDAYQKRRSLLPEEIHYWPNILVLSALRFWASRLAAQSRPGEDLDESAVIKSKDPDEYRRILVHRLNACT